MNDILLSECYADARVICSINARRFMNGAMRAYDSLLFMLRVRRGVDFRARYYAASARESPAHPSQAQHCHQAWQACPRSGGVGWPSPPSPPAHAPRQSKIETALSPTLLPRGTAVSSLSFHRSLSASFQPRPSRCASGGWGRGRVGAAWGMWVARPRRRRPSPRVRPLRWHGEQARRRPV